MINMQKLMKYIVLSLILGINFQGFSQVRITLEDALETALQNSPDIRRTRLNLQRNRESLNAEEARLKSNFSLTVTPIDYGRNRQFNDIFAQWYTQETYRYYGALTVRQPIALTDGTLSLTNRLQWQNSVSDFNDVEQRNKAYSNNLFLSYNQPLFTYNRTKLALRELQLALENASLQNVVQELTSEQSVTQNFYSVFREQESLKISQEEYQNQLKNYEIVKDKAESGLVAMEELFQAEVNLANSKSQLENQQVTVENVKDDFKILLGINVLDEIEVVTNALEAKPVSINLNTAIDHALESRVEIRQREIDMERAKNEVVRASATNEFRGDLSLSVGIFGDDPVLPQIYSAPTNSPNVSLSFTVPLWDWGEKRMRSVEMSIKTEEINTQNQQNTIIVNLRRSYRTLQNLSNQITISQQSLRNAQLTYEINLERYQNGDLTGLDLNQYQKQLSQSKMDLVSAKINYKLELLNMKIQSLWDFELSQSILPNELKNDKK